MQFAELAPLTYDYLVLALGAEVNFFGTEGAAEHAFPMYTLADAVRLKDHVLDRWEAADRDPALVEDGALNVVVVGGGPTGVETAGALAELYRGDFAKDYPGIPQEQARIILVEAGPGDLRDVQAEPARVRAEGAGEARRRGDGGRDRRVRLPHPRDAEVGRGPERAHARLGSRSAGKPDRASRSGSSSSAATGSRVGPELDDPGPSRGVRGRRRRLDHRQKTDEVLPQLGSVALQAGEHAGENVARRLAGKKTEPFAYTDKGTMATIGRGAAVVQMLGGRTMKGKAASLAWGAVHLALLLDRRGPGQGRCRLEWARRSPTSAPGRISVHTDEPDTG